MGLEEGVPEVTPGEEPCLRRSLCPTQGQHMSPPNLAWAFLYFKALTALALMAQEETQVAWSGVARLPSEERRARPCLSGHPACCCSLFQLHPLPGWPPTGFACNGKQGDLPQPGHIILPTVPKCLYDGLQGERLHERATRDTTAHFQR